MRAIKLMADYQCFPLWEASPGEVGNIDPEGLPIWQDLKTKLANWARQYDETLNMDYPPDSGFENAAVEAQFKQEGYLLADRLRMELGPEYEIKIRL
ncbi:hypothetical protein AB4156_40025 [Cupriavidus sp. 2MCAB6]|uniref:hypothetical protein n=1 Tax=Cupriavidus sp. 2MCAB6 TaxID=3232981 RepID=UPI003F90D8A0